MKRRQDLMLHAVLLVFLGLTMVPFAFVLNNSLRANTEQYRTFFGLPAGLRDSVSHTWYQLSGRPERIMVPVCPGSDNATANDATKLTESGAELAEGSSGWRSQRLSYGEALRHSWETLTQGYQSAWKELRKYMLNTILVSLTTTLGVLILGSISGYVFSRYRFFGRGVLFGTMLSILMIPPVLTLVPSFLLVKELGLLNSYWVLILPYVAGGQILATFLFKSFFDGLPEELFESARLEGAGHVALYWHLVLPLSKQVAAVVAVMQILGVWNDLLWPLVTNTESKYHMVSTGLYYMSQTATAQNFSAMYAAYVISSIPLIILFVYATKPFMQGVTSGAFKA